MTEPDKASLLRVLAAVLHLGDIKFNDEAGKAVADPGATPPTMVAKHLASDAGLLAEARRLPTPDSVRSHLSR